VTVRLIRHHTHAGVLHKPGDRITLPDAAARWLIDSGMARAARQDPKPTRTPRKE
jgi:hypothetical protein